MTRFRDYLACPYRYYLRHECELEAVDDAARELDGAAFGTLIHKVLGAFGRDRRGPRHSENQRDICEYLAERLKSVSKQWYGAEVRRPARWRGRIRPGRRSPRHRASRARPAPARRALAARTLRPPHRQRAE